MNPVMPSPSQENKKLDERISHFKNLVMLAFIDGHLDQSEIDWIYEKGEQAGLTREEVLKVILTPTDVEFTPPSTPRAAITQLLDLVTLMMADNLVLDHEKQFCKRVAVRLGIPPAMIDALIPKVQQIQREEATPLQVIDEMERLIRR